MVFILFSSPALGLTIHGLDKLKPIKTNGDFYQISKAICQITPEESSQEACCSGFQIAPDLVMTNYHCLSCIKKKNVTGARNLLKKLLTGYPGVFPTPDEVNQEPDKLGYVDFNHLKENTDLPRKKIKIKSVVAGNPKFDYVVIQLDSAYRQESLRLSSQPPDLNQRFISISHPSSHNYKVIDYSKSCVMFDADQELLDRAYRKGNFAHQCDTNPASSGSPIIDKDSDQVVGIHWSGGAEPSYNHNSIGFKNDTYNKAIKMSEIVKDLKNFPKVYKQLSLD